MLSRQEEEQERRETLENDRKLLDAERQRILREGTTMHAFAQSEANLDLGRYGAAMGKPDVVGVRPAVKYLQLPESSPWSGAQPQPGPEPPLSAYDNPALEPSAGLSAVEQLGDPASGTDTPSSVTSSDVQHTAAGSPLSHQDDGNG
jgi:hypothetical protein